MARKLTRGLSLVETIVALFILSGVVLLVVNLFPSSLASISRSDQILRSDQIAQSILDIYQCQPFNSLVVGENVTLPSQTWNNIVYTPSRLVYSIPNRNQTMLKGLKVAVSFTIHDQTRTTVHDLWVANVTH